MHNYLNSFLLSAIRYWPFCNISECTELGFMLKHDHEYYIWHQIECKGRIHCWWFKRWSVSKAVAESSWVTTYGTVERLCQCIVMNVSVRHTELSLCYVSSAYSRIRAEIFQSGISVAVTENIIGAAGCVRELASAQYWLLRGWANTCSSPNRGIASRNVTSCTNRKTAKLPNQLRSSEDIRKVWCRNEKGYVFCIQISSIPIPS